MSLPHADALSKIKDVLGPSGWSDDPGDMAPKLADWRGRYHGEAPLLARPKTTDEVAAVVSICNEAGLPILPQGGNTGLVGGSTPQGELLLSLERMRAIEPVDGANDSIVAEAGAVLANVHEAAHATGRHFPMSLGSQGSATIGGLISTNAGGAHVLRFGMMRDLVLGLEAVLPDGRVWNGLKSLRKDNTGYDLKQLFIGAEGTLGVVTKACLKLYPEPAKQTVAFVGIDSPAAAVELLDYIKRRAGDALTAFELIPKVAVELVLEHIPGVRAPLEELSPWHVLIEFGFFDADTAEDRLEEVLGDALETGLAKDAAIAASAAQASDFWKLRESIAEAERAHGKGIKHDVSVPVSKIAEFMDLGAAAALRLAPGAGICAFGHVGDGNIHFNITQPKDMDADAFLALQPQVHEAVHDIVESFGGSISAEHGIGTLKKAELAERRAGPEMDTMRAIKRALDPKNIMNPRALFVE